MRLSNPNDEPVYDDVQTVSFTGTRAGMTSGQKKAVRWLLRKLEAECLVHGDCTGADEDAGEIADSLGMEVRKRPSTHRSRAFTKVGTCVADPMPPLKRNQDIINDGDCVIACPRKMSEELRSGTWAAVRYARKAECLIWIAWPDGSLEWPV